jgi:hypothetical protein
VSGRASYPLCGRCQGSGVTTCSMAGPDVLITISMFDTVDEALESNAKSADWVRCHVLEFTEGLPEIMVGRALVAEVT